MAERHTGRQWSAAIVWAMSGVAVVMAFVLLVGNSDNGEAVRNCTEPGHECYERAQKNTAKAVGDINRVIIIAAACASKPHEQTVEQIATCVTRRLNDPQPLS